MGVLMLDGLTIYIPTRGRVTDQRTWAALPESVRLITFLVADEDDAESLDMLGYPVLTHQLDNIGAIRQWIIDQHDVDERGPHLLFLDDDLRFFYRSTEDTTKVIPLEPGSPGMEQMFVEYHRMLDHCSLAGIAPRHMSNRYDDPYLFNHRVYKTWGINVEVFRELQLQADRVTVGEDYDVFLQFLTHGRRMALLNTFISDDVKVQADGGCATYRTNEVSTESSLKVKGFFPEFVKLVERPPWPGSPGDVRLEMQVQWKKAYRAGVAQYGPEAEWPLDGKDAWHVQ